MVFRINFVNNINNNGYKEVFSSPLKSTNFPHQSHHLIYSKFFSGMTLVAISSEVNSSSKFPTSKVPVKTGIKGASNFLASKASKSNPWKKG